MDWNELSHCITSIGREQFYIAVVPFQLPHYHHLVFVIIITIAIVITILFAIIIVIHNWCEQEPIWLLV